jgi:hypothetical protein
MSPELHHVLAVSNSVKHVVIDALPPGLPNALTHTEYASWPSPLSGFGSWNAAGPVRAVRVEHREITFRQIDSGRPAEINENPPAVTATKIRRLVLRYADDVEVVMRAARAAVPVVETDATALPGRSVGEVGAVSQAESVAAASAARVAIALNRV